MTRAGPDGQGGPAEPADPADPADAGGPAVDRLRRELEAERAGSAHWREVARRQEAALGALKRRTSVRTVLALDRRTAGARAKGRQTFVRAADAGRRVALTATALPGRVHRAQRRRDLAQAVRQAEDTARALVESDARGRGTVVVAVVGADAVPAHLTHLDREGTTLDTTVEAVADESRLADLLSRSPARVVVLVHPEVEPLTASWLEAMAASLTPGVAAATGVLVHPERPLNRATPFDLLVRSAGYEVTSSSTGSPTVALSRAGSDLTSVCTETRRVAAVGAGLLAVDRQAVLAAGGWRSLGDFEASAVDLGLRLAGGGQELVAVGPVLALDHRPVLSDAELHRPFSTTDRADTAGQSLIAHAGPALRRAASPSSPANPSTGSAGPDLSATFTLTVASPSAKVATQWGDWHLAEALARSLADLGHPATVRTLDQADSVPSRSADVHLVLRGLARVARTPGQRHVLWVISHPEDLDTLECDQADLVLVASERFAHELRTRTSTPVEVLLQATDHLRFRPLPPVPAHSHPVTVVGKSRDVLRPMVRDALAAGLRPAIYGSGWRHLVDPSLVVSDHVANAELASIYSSAGVVLNDHWDTMRAWGFVSNRVFDVAACATPLVSDPLPELVELFGDAVATWRTPEELARAVHLALTDPRAPRRAAEARAVVLAGHTFEHRAAELLAILSRHGLVTVPADGTGL